jgi:hypothetical protein
MPTTSTHDDVDYDRPAPEEIIQWMAEDLLARCAGSYSTAHATIDGYDESTHYPSDSAMYCVMGLMSWHEDKAGAHEAIERHRQMRFS